MPILVKNGRIYSGTSSGSTTGSGSVEMTQAQYDALENPDPNIIYFITDGTAGYPSADNIVYDNTTSELTADNMQDAIDENASEIATVKAGLNNFKLVQFSTKVTLPDGTVNPTSTTVDFSDFVPSDYTIWGYSTPTAGTYPLPYIVDGESKTYITTFNAQAKTMTIKNLATAWNNYTLWFILFLKKN